MGNGGLWDSCFGSICQRSVEPCRSGIMSQRCGLHQSCLFLSCAHARSCHRPRQPSVCLHQHLLVLPQHAAPDGATQTPRNDQRRAHVERKTMSQCSEIRRGEGVGGVKTEQMMKCGFFQMAHVTGIMQIQSNGSGVCHCQHLDTHSLKSEWGSAATIPPFFLQLRNQVLDKR